MYSRSGLPGQCLLVNPRGSCPEFPSIYPDPEMCHPEPWNQVGKISIHPNLQGRRLGSLPGHQPRLSRLIGSEGPPACLTQSSPSWAARPHLDVNVVLSPLTGPFCSPPAPCSAQSAPRECPGPVHHFRRGRHLLVGAPTQHPQWRPQRLSRHLLVTLR